MNHSSLSAARRQAKILSLLLLVVGLPAQTTMSQPTSNTEETGRVIRILDGDTIEVLHSKSFSPTRIRIAEIDAPESKQDFGQASKQALAGICFNSLATFSTSEKDRYGRIVSHVQCGGIDAASYMVGNGLAWVYRQYSKTPHLIHLESAAKEGRKGLWSMPSATPPWEFRRGGK